MLFLSHPTEEQNFRGLCSLSVLLSAFVVVFTARYVVLLLCLNFTFSISFAKR